MSDIEDKLDDLLRRARAEVADVDLFAPPPPNEDCPICFLPYPRDESLSVFHRCCGKLICGGCIFKHLTLLGPREILGPKHICAFCRAPTPRGLDRARATENLMRKQNPHAFMTMAYACKKGDGVPHNERKALEMFAQAANVGYPAAYVRIGKYYRDGLIVAEDGSKCRAFLEIAAKKGSTIGHHNIAELNKGRGEIDSAAMKHHKVAACVGLQPLLTALIKSFKDGLLPKEELEHCLRAFQASDGKMKSKDRDAYLAYRMRRARNNNQL